MTDAEWFTELDAALVEHGKGWIVQCPFIAQNVVYSSVIQVTTGESKDISVSLDSFPTAEARRAEILRQLSSATV